MLLHWKLANSYEILNFAYEFSRFICTIATRLKVSIWWVRIWHFALTLKALGNSE